MNAKSATDHSVRILILALDQAGDVLDHVRADELDRPTPCADWDVSALVDHLVEAPARFLAMLTGREVDWSADPPHLAQGWGPQFRNHGDDLVHAWHQLDGDPPTPAAWQVAEFAVHTWDLATAIGFPVQRLDPEVAQTGLDFMRAHLGADRRAPVFGPEQPAPPDADPYSTLAAFAGRSVGG